MPLVSVRFRHIADALVGCGLHHDQIKYQRALYAYVSEYLHELTAANNAIIKSIFMCALLFARRFQCAFLLASRRVQ